MPVIPDFVFYQSAVYNLYGMLVNPKDYMFVQKNDNNYLQEEHIQKQMKEVRKRRRKEENRSVEEQAIAKLCWSAKKECGKQ
ncbi:hypothetical protein PM082_018184 [Marasmius tenuissimus]|nr:hypothetical protein PM082_018184 [Marasmius tenuissimus]